MDIFVSRAQFGKDGLQFFTINNGLPFILDKDIKAIQLGIILNNLKLFYNNAKIEMNKTNLIFLYNRINQKKKQLLKNDSIYMKILFIKF